MHQTRSLLFVLSLVLLFLGFILFATHKYGLTTTPDSITYFSTATNLVSGQGFILYDGSSYRNWPPLYPIILSLGVMCTIPIVLFAKIISCLAFALTVFFSYRFLNEHTKGSAVYIGTAMIACSYILFKLHILSCSEPLFILFFTVFLTFFIRYLQHFNKSDLFVAAFFMSLMCLQRYAGLMCLVWVFPFLGYGPVGNGKFKKACLFMAISIFPISVWALRNYLLNKEVLGQHALSDKINLTAVVENINTFWRSVHSFEATLIAGGIVLGLIVWTMTFIIVSQHKTKGDRYIVLTLLWVLCSGYGILLLFQSGLQLMELPRYLSIIYVPFSLYIILWVETQLKGNNYFYKATKYALVFFIAMQGTAVIIKTITTHKTGNGYETPEWMEGDAISFIRNELPANNIISNYPDFIWLIRRQQVKLSMTKGEDADAFHNRTAGAAYLFWIESERRSYCVWPEEYLQRPYKLTLIASGKQYRFFKIQVAE